MVYLLNVKFLRNALILKLIVNSYLELNSYYFFILTRQITNYIHNKL